MKRCSFIVCFALIIVLAMPISVSAAEGGTSSGKYNSFSCYLEFPDQNAICSSTMSTQYGNFGNFPLYFVFVSDGFYICTDDNYVITSDGGFFGGALSFARYTSYSLCGKEWNCVYYVPYGSSILGYTFNSEQDFLDNSIYFCEIYKLYDYDANYEEAVDFFQKPPVTGVLEKNLKTVMKTVDPLTEVVKILPIGLACLVGWIGLRKGLSLLRQVLFPA